MARRKRLEHFTEDELDALLHAPATRGLRTVVTAFRGDERSLATETPGDLEESAIKFRAPILSAPTISAPPITGLPLCVDDTPENIGKSDAAIVTRPEELAPPIFGGAEDGGPNTNALPETVVPFPGLVPPVLSEPKHRTRESGAPTISAPTVSALTFSAADNGAPAEPLDTSGLDIAEAQQYRRPRRFLPRLAHTVQDGHTENEQRVYNALWAEAEQQAKVQGKTLDPRFRIANIGDRAIAMHANVAYETARNAIRALQTKHSIEVRSPARAGMSKTFIIFSYTEVLRRRRAAGLTHYVRRTSTVLLVNPETYDPGGSPDVSSGALDFSAPSFGVSAPTLSAPTLPDSALMVSALNANSGALSFRAGIRNKKNTSLANTSSSSAVALVAAILREELNVVDNNAAERIIAGCRAKAPDATDAEIANLCREQAQRYRKMPTIDNPVGMLIRQLPNSFEGPAFEEFRKAQKQLREAEERRREAACQQWRRILDDPGESEEMKQIAREALEGPDRDPGS